MKKTKTQKGITLVALIITIVVLLILASVAIGAVKNSDIIGHAKDAANLFEIEKGKEDQEISDAEDLIEKYISGSKKDRVYYSSNEVQDFIVLTEDNKILSGNVEYLVEYIAVNDEIISNYNQLISSIGRTEVSSNLDNYSKAIVLVGEGVPEGTIYFLLNKEEDILYFLGTPFYLGSDKIGINSVKYLGKYVKYDSDGDGSVEDETILWRVLRNDGNKVELITADALGNLDLTSTDFNDARSKYNGAITAMVEECIRLTGIDSVRNVGGPAIDTITETVVFQDLPTFDPNPETDFSEFEGKNGFKVQDNNFEEDWRQMERAGVVQTDNSQAYWLASREVRCDTYYARFCVRYSIASGIYDSFEKLCEVHISATPYSHNIHSYAVRPVLTLKSGVLEGKTETGTKDQPIEIYQNT